MGQQTIVDARTGAVTMIAAHAPRAAPTSYRVPWLTFLDRMSDANATAALTLMNDSTKISTKLAQRIIATGIPSDNQQIRTWLTNQGEDPAIVLAY